MVVVSFIMRLTLNVKLNNLNDAQSHTGWSVILTGVHLVFFFCLNRCFEKIIKLRHLQIEGGTIMSDLFKAHFKTEKGDKSGKQKCK